MKRDIAEHSHLDPDPFESQTAHFFLTPLFPSANFLGLFLTRIYLGKRHSTVEVLGLAYPLI